MIKCLHLASAVVLLGLASFTTQADLPEKFKTDKIRGAINKQIANLNLSFGTKFLSISETGFSASLGYKYGVQPSYQDGFYSRFDKYPGTVSVNPAKWIDNDTKLALSVSGSAEIQFVRQFRNQKEAFTAWPPSPVKSPINSKRAIKDLAVGDYASLIYNISAFAGFGSSWDEVVRLSAQAGHTLATQYGAQVFRLRENHIRLRLFAERSNGPGFSIGSKANKDDFDLFGTEYLNDALRKLIKLDIFGLSASTRKREAYLADFVINLNDSKAQEAYDNVMKRVIALSEEKFCMLNSVCSEEEIIDYLLDYTKELENLFQEDLSRKAETRRVTRIFLGKDLLPVATSQGFRFGNAIFSYKTSRQYFENNLTYLGRDNEVQRYSLPDYEFFSGFKFLFSFFQEETRRSANALLPKDVDDKIITFEDIGFLYEFRDKRLTSKEFKDIRENICGILDKNICEQIDWSDYKNRKTENFRLRVQYILNPEAFHEIAKMSNYYESIVGTLTRQHHSILKDITPSNSSDCSPDMQCDLISLHMYSIENLLKNFYLTFHNKDPEVSFQAFTSLRYNPIFNVLGGRILMDMIPENKRQFMTTTVVEVTGSNREKISEVFAGDPNTKESVNNRRELYDYVKNIQNSIFNRGFDLRLQGVYGDLAHLNP